MGTRWLAGVGSLLFVGLCAGPSIPQALRGHNDFVATYTGASLLYDGLYSPERTVEFQREQVGFSRDGLLCIRPPFFALLFRPFSWMPYRVAYLAFQGLNLIALAWFIWMFRGEVRGLLVIALLFLPVAGAFLQGQDIVLVMSAAAGAVLLRRAGRPFLAGLVFSLCAVKIHLFLLVPVALVFRKEWRMLTGGAVGVVSLTALSFAVVGHNWLPEYFLILKNPQIHTSNSALTNLRGLVLSVTGQEGVVPLIVCSLMVAGVAVYGMWRSRDLEVSLALALLSGVVTAYHTFIYDLTLFLLVAVLLARHIRNHVGFAVLPGLYLFVFLPPPYRAALPAVLVMMVGAVMTWGAMPSNGERTPAEPVTVPG